MKLAVARRGILYLALLIAAVFALPLAAATPAAKPTAATLVKKQPAPKPKTYSAPTAKKVAKSKGAVAERDWTLMYYLDADCNLEPDMLDDMDELESIGSTDNVNILVLLDRTPDHDPRDGNWSNARLLYVTRDATNGKLKSKILNNLKEMDTANPETLVGFVAFGLQNFPAKHYALVLGNHGGTWMGMLNDETDNQGGMKLAPFIQGLEALKKAGAPKFDVIGFDMCLMAQVEVMDAISPYASYGVASEELEPGAGYPNHRVLQALTKNPKMSGRDFAQTMVREWGASYAEAGEATVTSSATDLAKVKDLTTAVDALATALVQADGSVQAAAAKARAATHFYGGEEGGGDLASFDLGEFAGRLAKEPSAAPIQAQLAAVQAAVATAVIEHKEGAAHVGSTGLAIYFPVGQKVDPGYASLPFVRGQWDEFLAKGVVGASGAGGSAAAAGMSVAISSPDPSATHPIGNGLPVTAQVKGNPAAILASIGYRDADGGITLVHQEEVASPGGWKDGTTFTYNVQPKVRAISDGKNARMVPTTPLTAGSRYVRADASYNSMRGDQKVTTVFDTKTGKLETIFCESEKGSPTPMAVHPVKGEKLVFYQPTVSKDKKTQKFRPVPALVSSGSSARGKAKAGGDDLKLLDSGIPGGAYVLALTAYDATGKPAGGSELNLTAGGGAGSGGGAGGGAGAGGGPAVAPGLAYPDYGYPAVGYDDLDYVDLTQIIPAGEYDQFEADWSDYNYMLEYQVDDFSAADLVYLQSVALDPVELDFDRQDWSDEFDIYSLEHPGDVDGDGTPDATDMDDDNDGTPDAEDLDDDDDGDPDADDDDDDNDGIPDETDADDDGDGTPDDADTDDDNDGTADADEDEGEDEDEGDDAAEDSDEDHDGTPDDEDADDDNDGTPDTADADDDNDGTPDTEDDDDDNDGTSDAEESDEDGDGTPDDEDADDDNDGTADDADTDDDNDGTPDDADTDDDNDGTSDEDEAEDDGGDEAEDDGGDDAEDDGGDEAEDDGGDEAEDDGGDEAEDDGGDEGEDDGGDEGEEDGGDEGEEDGGDEGEEDGGDEGEG